MKRFIYTALVLLLCWTSIVSAQSETSDPEAKSAADRESARDYFRMGVDFYRERNFRAALIEFQRAYKAYPHYRLLYNLGQTSAELQDYASAIDYLTAYLHSGGNEIAIERRQEVEDSIKQFEARLATVTITGSVEGAEVFVDDTSVGTLPLEKPIVLSSGRRVLSAFKQGLPRVEKTIDIAAGDHRTVHLEFDEPASAWSQTSTQSRINWPAIGTGIATGTFAAAGITFAVLTAISEKDYEDERRRDTTEPVLSELRRDTKTKALLTDLLFGAAILSAATTVVFYFVFGEESSDTDEKTTAKVGITPFGVQMAVDGWF